MPYTRPSQDAYLRWAENSSGTEGTWDLLSESQFGLPNVIDPSSGIRDQGFTAGGTLSAQFLNALFNRGYRYLKWLAEVFPSEVTAGGAVRFGRKMAGLFFGGDGTSADPDMKWDSATSSLAGWRVLAELPLSGGMYARVYNTGTGTLRLTINAQWNGAAWVPDAAGAGQVSSRLSVDAGVLTLRSYIPADLTPFPESAFINNYAILRAGNTSMISHALEVLGALTASGGGTLAGTFAASGATIQQATLEDSTLTGTVDVSGVTFTSGTPGEPGLKAVGNGSGEGVRATPGTLATATTPSTALKAVSGYVVFDPAVNPNSNVAFTNSLTPKNICKAWAVIDSGSPPALINGFNIASVAANSIYIDVTFAGAFANANYAPVLSSGTLGLILNTLNPTTTTVRLTASDTAGASVDLSTAGKRLYLVVLGEQ